MKTDTLDEPATEALPAYLTVEMVMARWLTSRSFVYSEMDSGRLESKKMGRCRRISRDALLAYEAAATVGGDQD